MKKKKPTAVPQSFSCRPSGSYVRKALAMKPWVSAFEIPNSARIIVATFSVLSSFTVTPRASASFTKWASGNSPRHSHCRYVPCGTSTLSATSNGSSPSLVRRSLRKGLAYFTCAIFCVFLSCLVCCFKSSSVSSFWTHQSESHSETVGQ